MDVQLVVAHGKAGEKQIALGSETLIGRSPECNLRIASGQVSRKHCLIRVADDRVSVRDLGSAYGTRLNGQAIATEVDVPVAPGSTLVVGPLKFIVQFTAPKRDDDTEFLESSSSSARSDLREVQQMATAPVVDGEETKDYAPSRARQRGAAPPLVGSDHPVPEAGRVEDAGGEKRPSQSRTTESEFEGVSKETVFDSQFAGDAGTARRPETGNETDFIFEADDLRQLAAAIEGGGQEAPVADSPAGPAEALPAEGNPKQGGWRLLDMLRRKKETSAPATCRSSARR